LPGRPRQCGQVVVHQIAVILDGDDRDPLLERGETWRGRR
jgi:hypothetical protein